MYIHIHVGLATVGYGFRAQGCLAVREREGEASQGLQAVLHGCVAISLGAFIRS